MYAWKSGKVLNSQTQMVFGRVYRRKLPREFVLLVAQICVAITDLAAKRSKKHLEKSTVAVTNPKMVLKKMVLSLLVSKSVQTFIFSDKNSPSRLELNKFWSKSKLAVFSSIWHWKCLIFLLRVFKTNIILG
jgi:hypothetical protein